MTMKEPQFDTEKLIAELKKHFTRYDFQPHRDRWWNLFNWYQHCCGVRMRRFDAFYEHSGVRVYHIKPVACSFCGATDQVVDPGGDM